MTMDDKGADLLTEAIILNAIRDYKYALKWKDAKPKNKYQESKVNTAIRLYNDVRKFFHSQWYKSMCSIDGDKLLNRIEEEYKKGIDRKTKRKAAKTL